jgi:hypothetical protein
LTNPPIFTTYIHLHKNKAMKKLFLLLTAGSIGITLHAQENRSVLFGTTTRYDAKQVVNDRTATPSFRNAHRGLSNANKTTTTMTSRWYNYGEALDTMLSYAGANVMGLAVNNIWGDTSGSLVYTSGIAHNTMVSSGSVFMPQAMNSFNNANYYAGQMMLTNEAYNIDSVVVYGDYIFNPAKTSVVDTLTVSFTQGTVSASGDDIFFGYFNDAASLSAYNVPASVGRLGFAMETYDSVTNTNSGTSVYTLKFPLTSANWGDTNSNGIWSKVIKLPVAYNVTSGNFVGIAISFKSGDASFIFGDTLNSQYNRVRPLLAYTDNGSGTAMYAPYDSTDFNSGQYKTLPNYENGWGDVYVPMYAWTSGGSASVLQHNYMDIHVNCTSCTKVVGVTDVVKNVSNVGVYPNPAESQVNFSFNLKNTSSAVVTLSNTLGQVVASQTSNGKASFNVASLPAGVYVYSIVANGEQTTGRITVAH